MDCDVILLPPSNVTDVAIRTSRDLSRFGTSFTLNGKSYFPHLSLFWLHFDISKLEKIKSGLQDIAKQTAPLELIATDYDSTPGWLVVDYHKSAQLVALQEQILKDIEPLRDGMMDSTYHMMQTAQGLALDNYRRYGDRYIGDLFKPHITLTHFEDGTMVYDAKLPNIKTFGGTFTKLGLFEFGPYHTCVRRAAEYQLR